MLTDDVIREYAGMAEWEIRTQVPPATARAMAQEILRLRALHAEIRDGLDAMSRDLARWQKRDTERQVTAKEVNHA